MLKAKVDAGATRAITQFFFENDLYFRYLDRVRARGIDIPIVPGILPVQNFKAATNFATRAGASVPAWLAERFHGLDNDRGDAQADRRRGRRRAGARSGRPRRHHFSLLHHEPRRPRSTPSATCWACGRRRKRWRSERAQSIRRRAEAAHPGARRRHGHHDPGAQARRGGLSRRALRRLEPRGARQQRPLELEPPRRGARHPSGVFPRRRRHRFHQHVLLHQNRPGRLRHGGHRLRTQPCRRHAGARGGLAGGKGRRPPPFRRRRARPDQPHRLDLAGCEQSRLPRHQFRPAARGLRRANPRAARRRHGLVADRNHLRHAQCQGGDLRDFRN